MLGVFDFSGHWVAFTYCAGCALLVQLFAWKPFDGTVDGKIVLPPFLPAWIVSMDCMSFFSMSMFLIVRLSSENDVCDSLTVGRTANAKDAAGLSGFAHESSWS